MPLKNIRRSVDDSGTGRAARCGWSEVVHQAQGVTHFYELGPKDVLTGLLKRIAPTAAGMACGTVDGVQQTARVLREQAAQS